MTDPEFEPQFFLRAVICGAFGAIILSVFLPDFLYSCSPMHVVVAASVRSFVREVDISFRTDVIFWNEKIVLAAVNVLTAALRQRFLLLGSLMSRKRWSKKS